MCTGLSSLICPSSGELVRQRALHAACGECLAEPIAPETFHITLHDLLSGPPDALDAAQLAQAGRRAKEVLLRIRGRFLEEIHLRPVSIFNMVNTSLVAGFAPATEADCATLMGLYEAFQQVVRLPYHLTPHATIAYFRLGRYGRDQMARLQSAIDGATAIDAGRSIRLELSRLHYCDFEDMNHYWREGAAPGN